MIRENGSPPSEISCKLVQMPLLFTPPLGLMPVDGTLEVVDFYNKLKTGNETAIEAGGNGDESGNAVRRMMTGMGMGAAVGVIGML